MNIQTKLYDLTDNKLTLLSLRTMTAAQAKAYADVCAASVVYEKELLRMLNR